MHKIRRVVFCILGANMNRFVKVVTAVFTTLLISHTANAAFIVNGNTGVSSLNLSESFVDFYDRGGNVDFSSNTGFEQNDSLVLFIAEYLGDFALIGLIDGTSATGDDSGGTLDISISDLSSTFGDLTFVDDPKDPFVTTATGFDIVFEWGRVFNDGFIYELGNESTTEISLLLGNVTNLFNLSFLDFSGNSPQSIALGNPSDENTVLISTMEVNSPSTLLLFAFALLALGRLKR